MKNEITTTTTATEELDVKKNLKKHPILSKIITIATVLVAIGVIVKFIIGIVAPFVLIPIATNGVNDVTSRANQSHASSIADFENARAEIEANAFKAESNVKDPAETSEHVAELEARNKKLDEFRTRLAALDVSAPDFEEQLAALKAEYGM